MKSRSNQSAIRRSASLTALSLSKGNPQSAFRNRAFTMIELLVAVTILVVMLLMFAMILTQSQKVVSGAERMMRRNAAATAIKDTFREDLRRATKHGFLCILQMATNQPPRLMIATAGPTPSKTHPFTGTGAVAYYGLCNNVASSSNPSILFYQRWVLIRMDPAAVPAYSDIFYYDLADVQVLSRDDLNNQLVEGFRLSSPPGPGGLSSTSGPPISIPPQNSNDVAALWQVLATDCQYLSIMWTDGTVSLSPATGKKTMNWYGVEYDPTATPPYVAYARNPGSGKPEPGDWRSWPFTSRPKDIEFNAGANTYRAIWSNHDQSIWPKAIRIRFGLADADDPNQTEDFEVICPVGR